MSSRLDRHQDMAVPATSGRQWERIQHSACLYQNHSVRHTHDSQDGRVASTTPRQRELARMNWPASGSNPQHVLEKLRCARDGTRETRIR